MSELVQRLDERAAQLDEADRPMSDAKMAADEIRRLLAVLMRAQTVLIGLKVSPRGKDARLIMVDEIDEILHHQQQDNKT